MSHQTSHHWDMHKMPRKIICAIANVVAKIIKINKHTFLQYLYQFSANICNCNDVHYVIACILLDRYLVRTPRVITKRSIYKLYAVALIIALKTHSDLIYKNTFYSDVTEIDLPKLNKLELEFCFTTDFDFVVTKDAFDTYYEYLLCSHF